MSAHSDQHKVDTMEYRVTEPQAARHIDGSEKMNRSIHKYLLMVVLLLGAGAPLWAAVLNEVRVNDQGEQLQFILDLDQAPADPTVFTTDQPPRIVVDLPGTTSSVAAAQVPVGIGPVRSYTALSAGDRTRLVVDLSRSVGHSLEVAGDRVVLNVDARSSAARSQSQASGSVARITGVDFRRSPEGAGRIIIDLDQPGVNVSVDPRGRELRIDLFNTRLPESLMQRLDVVDFATPVQTITPEVRGDNTRLHVEVKGAYTHMAYQNDRQLVVEVTEPPRQVAERNRDLQFFQEREYTGERITLNFQDIPVRSVLQLIADISDLNIVVSDSVTGNLTLRLTNVPWDQALDIVLETRNLAMRESGNVRWVAPAAEIAAREQQILEARAARQELEPLRTAMIPVSYAKATALAELIRSAGTASEENGNVGLLSARGSVSVDERTNTLLVTDTAEQIDSVRALVSELDRPVRQVLIEGRIVIARSTFTHELGVRFGVSGMADVNNNVLSLSGSAEANDRMNNVALARRQFLGQRPGRPGFLPDADPPQNIGDPIEIGTGGIAIPTLQDRLNVNLPVTNPAGALGISFLADNLLLDLELSALEAQGEGEVISSPRVITANQREAYIQQGVEIPFEEATNSGATNIEFKEAVLELRVTPLITPDNRIQLDLTVKQDTVGEILTPGLEPSIDTREVGTSILVDNGQTVVLGGILQETRNFNVSKVPMLGDVPVLGTLFRRRSTEDEKRELLIFVTPTILDDQVVFD